MFEHVHTTKLIQEESNEQVCRVLFIFLFLHFPTVQHKQRRPCLCSHHMLTSTLPTLQPFHYTKQTWQQQFLSYSVTTLERWRPKLVSRSRWKRGLLIFICPIYLGVIQHIGIKPTDFIVLAEAQRTCTCQSKYGTFCELFLKNQINWKWFFSV